MTEQHFILPVDTSRERLIERIAKFLAGLSKDKPWKIVVSRYSKKRSNPQNAYLWGCVYPTILKAGHEHLGGWIDEDLHDYFLGLHFGTEVMHFNGRDHERPLRRSSKLNTVEFIEFVGRIQMEMAQIGIFIPDPNPYYALERERSAA